MRKKISVDEAAKLMNKSSQFVRVGLQQNVLPIGAAVRNKGRYSYYISPDRLREFLGMSERDFEREIL